MLRTALIGMALLLLAGESGAQSPGERLIDPAFAAWIDRHGATTEAVDLYVQGDAERVAMAVRALGGRVKMARAGWSSVRLPVQAVRALAAAPGVRGLDFDGAPGTVLNDSMRVTHLVNAVHAGLAPLPQAFDGQDVVVGMIDAGLDIEHPDMLLPDGRTRVLRFWDQTKPVNELTPEPYGYGQAWDSTQINAGLMGPGDQTPYFGHGTLVTGTAAGNAGANGRHKGVAPAADLVVVSVNMGAGNFRARVADGVHYILQAAAAVGKPAVINASVGTYLGSHDGLDPSALLIDDMLQEQPGRAMVCAVGNSNSFAPYHLRTDVTPDTSFTWFLHNNNSGLGFPAVFFELWADQDQFNEVQFAVGADRVAPALQFRGRTPFRTAPGNVGQAMVDTLRSPAGHQLAVVQYFLAERGDQYRMQVLLQQPDSSAYRFRFITTGTGRFDVWSHAQFGTSTMVASGPSPEVYPPMAQYVPPDNHQHIVDSWACSPHVVTVGNHYGVEAYMSCDEQVVPIVASPAAIAATSSKGPTRTGLVKPDISATGDVLMSTCPLYLLPNLVANEPFKLAQGCMHVRNGGSSMSSPVVAGTVALLLQQCPYATAEGVREALAAGAMADSFTGEVPNSTWGHGKLDAFATLVAAMPPPVDIALLGPDTLCEGEVTEVTAAGGHAHYLWSDGSTGPSITVGQTGPVSVTGFTSVGCHAFSDTLHIVVHPAPATPVVQVDGALLQTTADDLLYQWFLDGEPVAGATGPEWEAQSAGLYTVQVTDANGCTAMSAPHQVLFTGVGAHGTDRPMLWPSPVGDVLHVRPPAGPPRQLAVLDEQGRVVHAARIVADPMRIDVAHLAPGLYTVLVSGVDGNWAQRFIKLP